MARGHYDPGRYNPETCNLSRKQLLIAEELILMGLDAENFNQVVNWQIATLSGIQQAHPEMVEGERKFREMKLELFLKAADSAFPYMDLSSTFSGVSADKQKLIEAGKKVEEVLEMNPNMTAEEFLTADI